MTNSPRNLTDVLERCLAIIPDTETHLLERLKSVHESTCYCHPQNIGLWWHRAAEVFNEEMPQIDNPEHNLKGWQKDLYREWMNK